MGKKTIYCGGAGNGSVSFSNSSSSLRSLQNCLCTDDSSSLLMLYFSRLQRFVTTWQWPSACLESPKLLLLVRISASKLAFLQTYSTAQVPAAGAGIVCSSPVLCGLGCSWLTGWIIWSLRALSIDLNSDTYNPVPGVMMDVPSSRNYDGGFTSKLMVWCQDTVLSATSN